MSNRPARLLVVDDAPLTRGLLEHALRKYGYAVETASNGQQAVEYFIKHHPDLILMDADMPIVDGVTACARIRELPDAKHLPIIIVTALVERQWIDRAYAAGATDYITKPVNLDVLRNRIHYILQAKRAEEALFDEKEKAQVTLASICDGVIATDAKGRVEFLNPNAIKITGWTTEEAKGLALSQVFSLIDENTQQPIEFPIQRCLEKGKMLDAQNTLLLHRDGKKQFAIEEKAAPIKARNGRIIGVVVVFHDVTETRKMTQTLAYKATHDALTGLYNRHEFNARLKRVLQAPRDEKSKHALLYMDLDRFKVVNDTCGHEAGDQLLKDVALLLQKNIDAHTGFALATLARLGGDEFGLLLENCSKKKSVLIAKSLCESLESYRFFWTNDQQEKNLFTIGISIGLVPISTQTLNPKSIIAMADAACYAAKNTGRRCIHIYQENDTAPANSNIQWISLIHDNLEKDQGFSLFYQPILPLRKSPNVGNCYEILLRIADPQNQLVPLGAFLSAATRYNLMPTLDRWVICKVLKWLTTHPQHLEKLSLITINISGYSLCDQHFLKRVISDIDNTEIPAQKLCFEITENTALTNFTGVLNFMTPLKKRGCRFALDNFGSGIASFAYLKNLPVDFLKIDGALIKNLLNDTVDYAMVKSINDIAHLMSIQTMAENVENQATLKKLKDIGIDYVQGNWIGEPKPLSP